MVGIPPVIARKARLANLVAGVVALAFVGGAVLYNRSLGARADVGRPAPGFTLAHLDGGAPGGVSLAQFRGRPVLINFWTTWCDPCREEIPSLVTFHERFGDRLPVVGINVREPRSTVSEFVKAFAINYPVALDLDGKVAERYRLRGYPESWLVDAQGVARRFWPGPLTFEELERAYREVTGRPVAAGASRGGPLPADAVGVAVVQTSTGPLAISRGGVWRLGDNGVGGDRVAMPPEMEDAGSITTAVAANDVVVATGSRLWIYRPQSGQWRAVASAAPGPILALAVAGAASSANVAGSQGDEMTLVAYVGGHGLMVGRAQAPSGEASAPVVTWAALEGSTLPADLDRVALAVDGATDQLAVGTPAGLFVGRLVRVATGEGVRLAGQLAMSRLQRPVAGVAPGTLTGRPVWLAATDRGIWAGPRTVPTAEVPAAEWSPLPGTPVRAFGAVAADASLAMAVNGDLYRHVGAQWVLWDAPRPERAGGAAEGVEPAHGSDGGNARAKTPGP